MQRRRQRLHAVAILPGAMRHQRLHERGGETCALGRRGEASQRRSSQLGEIFLGQSRRDARKSDSTTTRSNAVACVARRRRARRAAMDPSSARSAPAGPSSSRRRCLAGCRPTPRAPWLSTTTRGRRRDKNASKGRKRRSSDANTSAGRVHATGAPGPRAGRSMPPSHPAAASAAPFTPFAAAPFATASARGGRGGCRGGVQSRAESNPSRFARVTANGRSHVAASTRAAYVYSAAWTPL